MVVQHYIERNMVKLMNFLKSVVIVQLENDTRLASANIVAKPQIDFNFHRFIFLGEI